MSDEGLELLKGFVAASVHDYDDFGEPYCRLCGLCGMDRHEPDCLWARARAYLRDQGVEIEDDE